MASVFKKDWKQFLYRAQNLNNPAKFLKTLNPNFNLDRFETTKIIRNLIFVDIQVLMIQYFECPKIHV